MDNFYKQVTPAYTTKLYGIYLYLSTIMAALTVISLFVFIPASIVAAVLTIVFFILRGYEQVKYEYIFSNDNIEINVIKLDKLRKKIMSFNIGDVLIAAPKKSKHLEDAPRGKKIHANTKETASKEYIAVISKAGEIVELHFIPDEEFINICAKSNYRGFKRQ